jgi:predicted PurR-regulated permease PerM
MSWLEEVKERTWFQPVIVVAAIVAALSLVWALWSVLVFFLFAVVAAYICAPAVNWIESKGVSRSAGVSIVAIALLSGVALFWIVAVPMFAREILRLTSDLPKYIHQSFGTLIPWLENSFKVDIPHGYQDWARQLSAHEDTIKTFASRLSEPIWTILKQTFTSLYAMIMTGLSLIVVPVAWFYLLRDADPLKVKVTQFIPERIRTGIFDLLGEIDEVVGNFLQGQLIVMFLLAILYVIGLEFIVGVPLGFLIGIFAGLLSFVPYLGLILGVVPALLLCLLEFGFSWHILGVVGVFAVVQGLEGTVITPRIVGDKLGLHPLTVIFGILIWGELLGFTGILIAVPATAVMQVGLKRGAARYFESKFFRRKKLKEDETEPG